MLFSKDFFALNLSFARKISEVTGLRLQRSLLDYTHLYLAFGLGRDFNSQNSIWDAYLHGVKSETDLAEYTHQFYLAREVKQPKQEPENVFGCFSYAHWKGNRVRLHFRNATRAKGALQKQNVSERIAELRAMFTHLKEIVPITSTVVGGSWLYNVESYRRLFPEKYLESAQTGDDEYQFIALWGQFLCYDGTIHQQLGHMFLERIANQKTLSGVTSCFPYPVLRLESPIRDFYTHFDIE